MTVLFPLPPQRGSTPLHLATRRGHIAIALMLVHAGCNIDALDHAHETPLHPAAMEGLLPIVQTLCAFGCQVTHQTMLYIYHT